LADGIDKLVDVMARLRDPKSGCPWDLEQDHRSLRPYVIEEAFEVVEAIDTNDPKLLKEELGDLLLQVVFHARLKEEEGGFTFDEVADQIAEKMIRRHPHVFGEETVAGADEVALNWEVIKAKEKGERGTLSGVPNALPGLLKALRIGEKAAGVGFDWQDHEGIYEKISEEWGELREAIEDQDGLAIEHEFGDILFALTSLARHLRVDPEASLQGTLRRFQARFEWMEQALKNQNKKINEVDMVTLNQLWGEAKAALKHNERKP
tara:strand:- start:948 stop:1739 length:792 start_codon:yes stop_codon:yes gene_type:complete